MRIATILQNKISRRKLFMIVASVGVPLVLAGVIAAFFLIQGTISNAGEGAPIGVNASVGSTGEALITFETAKTTTPTIRYGTSPDALSEIAVGDFDVVSHTVSLKNLQPNTTYYYSIAVGTELYDNEGALWTFTTPASLDTPSGEDPLSSIAVAIEGTITPSQVASISATIVPTPTIASPSATITPAVSATPSASITPAATAAASSVCKSNNCISILGYLGTQCSTQDYVKCIQNVNITITQAPTNTTTPTPISAAIKSSCAINSFQSNSCTSWIWQDMTAKDKTCSDVFTKYFIQCKSNSFTSNDASTWYCNKTVTSNQLTIPCDTAPTPAPGQSIFCRVRAETELGGDANATDWIYTNGSCSSYANLSTVSNCQVGYLQQNTCGKWNWSLNNATDPQCTSVLDHYKVQCTSNGIFTTAGATTPTPYWYCNTTSTTSSLDMPCGNAITPANGTVSTCRVRPEDAYGTDAHAGDWTTTTATCPTSTPTPSNTPTPTNTPTKTPTPTP